MIKITSELRALGKKSPQLLLNKLDRVDLTEVEFLIMKFRYVEGLDFKQIPLAIQKVKNQAAPYSDSWIFKVHKKALKKTVARLRLADWLGLFVQ